MKVSKQPTYWEIIELTLEKAKKPLTREEIWTLSEVYGTRGNKIPSGVTPWATISAICYTDIRDNKEKSLVYQADNSPPKFYLRKYIEQNSEEVITEPIEITKKETKYEYHERDLHPLAVAYIHKNFGAYSKTVYHEKSLKKIKGQDKWENPDIVSYKPAFSDINPKIIEITGIKPLFYSFELKKDLTFSNYKEYLHQSLSNSNWAQESYLMTVNLEEDPSFMEELSDFSKSYGIGIIKLNINDIYQSEILFPSNKKELNCKSMQKLCNNNSDFANFVNSIYGDKISNRVHKEDYDKILSADELENFIIEKKIK